MSDPKHCLTCDMYYRDKECPRCTWNDATKVFKKAVKDDLEPICLGIIKLLKKLGRAFAKIKGKKNE